MAELTYRDAVAAAIAQEMDRDENVVFLGETMEYLVQVNDRTQIIVRRPADDDIGAAHGRFRIGTSARDDDLAVKIPSMQPRLTGRHDPVQLQQFPAHAPGKKRVVNRERPKS